MGLKKNCEAPSLELSLQGSILLQLGSGQLESFQPGLGGGGQDRSVPVMARKQGRVDSNIGEIGVPIALAAMDVIMDACPSMS